MTGHRTHFLFFSTRSIMGIHLGTRLRKSAGSEGRFFRRAAPLLGSSVPVYQTSRALPAASSGFKRSRARRPVSLRAAPPRAYPPMSSSPRIRIPQFMSNLDVTEYRPWNPRGKDRNGFTGRLRQLWDASLQSGIGRRTGSPQLYKTIAWSIPLVRLNPWLKLCPSAFGQRRNYCKNKRFSQGRGKCRRADTGVLLCVLLVSEYDKKSPITERPLRSHPSRRFSFPLLSSHRLHTAPEFLVFRIHSEGYGYFTKCPDPGRPAKSIGRNIV